MKLNLKRVVNSDTKKNEQIYKANGMNLQHLPAMNEPVKAGEETLSIQCSWAHHCTPRITTSLDQYKSVEFAVLCPSGFKGIEEVFGGYPRIEELREMYDGSVYSYIPIELMENVIEWLNSK